MDQDQPDSGNQKPFPTKTWRSSISEWPKPLVAIVSAIFASIASPLLVNHLTKSQPSIEAYYAVTDTKPFRPDALGKLVLKYGSDRQINQFELSVTSTGSESVKGVYIDVRAMKPKLFSSTTILYDPLLLEEHTSREAKSAERIYLELPELPIEASVAVIVESAEHFDEKDLSISILGSGRQWNATKRPIILRERRSPWSSLKRLFSESQIWLGVAYAQEPSSGETPAAPKAEAFSKISIGGYNPIVLSNEIFQILQNRKIVDREEAEKIKKSTEELKSGVTLGGIDVLRFDEEVLNALIRKRIIERSEAEEILDRSRRAGGVLINGYNVIQLKAGILHILVIKERVSLSEAQSALDKAKTSQK